MILTILTHTADGSFYSSKKMLRNHLPQKSLGTSVPSLMNLGSDLTAIVVQLVVLVLPVLKNPR